MSDEEAPSISVKLSALFPRYEYAQRERVLAELGPRLLQLVVEARSARIALTIDAEESERLELSLELIDRVLQASVSAGWGGFGVAVQAYQKRAPDVLRWLISRARVTRRRLNIRLVKGAYWDSEIKRAQERGLSGYPVFTRKINTDVSYLACVRLLLEGGEFVYPQFATHNAHTVASVIRMAQVTNRAFEFQRLHGMGEELYAEIVGVDKLNIPCRVYAPVGAHADLLPYLVRRLLENGANTSFVNRIVDDRLPAIQIAADPIAHVEGLKFPAHPALLCPVTCLRRRASTPPGSISRIAESSRSLRANARRGSARTGPAGPRSRAAISMVRRTRSRILRIARMWWVVSSLQTRPPSTLRLQRQSRPSPNGMRCRRMIGPRFWRRPRTSSK